MPVIHLVRRQGRRMWSLRPARAKIVRPCLKSKYKVAEALGSIPSTAKQPQKKKSTHVNWNRDSASL
jgi:hypothetical protein